MEQISPDVLDSVLHVVFVFFLIFKLKVAFEKLRLVHIKKLNLKQ